jgi:PAS domain S-box-containing protein
MKIGEEYKEPYLPLPRYIITVFSVLVAGIIIVGYLYYVHQIQTIKRDKQDELEAIADLKADELMRWQQERINDVEMVSGNPILDTIFNRWLKGDDSPGLYKNIRGCMESIMRTRQYHSVSLFNTDLSRRISIPEDNEPVSPEVTRFLLGHQQECHVQFIDIHHLEKNGPLRLGLLIPVPGCTSSKENNTGYVYMEIDPNDFLFPLIQSWPTSSRTAETLLVRREGNDVIYLNELRHIKNSALLLRSPISRKDLPAARAVLGYEGVMEGYDYRGKAVLAFIKKIPDSPWFMVAKVDREEIYAPIRTAAFIITLVISLMIIGSGSFMGMWYRGRQAGMFRRQLMLEQERSILADRVSLLAKHANDVIFLLDQDWRILEANDRAIEIYGYSLEELQRMHLYDLRTAETKADFDQQVEPIESQGDAIVETIHRRKDGTALHVESSARLVKIGGETYIMDIIRDITGRKKAEEEVLKVMADLERSNKELEQFAYVASHDLQEPLRMVSSFTQLLAKRYQDKLDQDARDYIDFAVKGSNRMQRMIQDLLNYSRVVTRGRAPAPTDMDNVLDETLANLHMAISESGASVTHDALPVVMADHSQLVQVFQNLIGNSIKFRRDDPLRIHVSAGKIGDEWVFSVKDNGMGIEPLYFERIFVLFERLHAGETYRGTGIGLALCKRIIQRLGGRIWVESEPNRGSTFYFTLKGAE